MHQFSRILIILTIITFWWTRVDSGQSAGLIDCEKYVFHPQCRGSQARKRMTETVRKEKANKVCICKCGLRNSYGGKGQSLFSNSKLLEAMLSHGFDVDTIYDAYFTYLSSSAAKDRTDETRGGSISSKSISSSGRNSRSKSSSSSSTNRHHRDDQSGVEEGIRLPLSDNTIDFTNSDMDLDYLS